MKKIVFAAAALAAMAITAPAFADSGTNASIGYTDITGSGYSFGLLNARVGWNSNGIGVEGEAGTGLQSSHGVKISSEFGGFVTGQVEASKDFDLFARVGYATVSATGGSDSGFAYGVGAQMFFDMANGVRVEYTNYHLGSSTSSYGISYVRKFK